MASKNGGSGMRSLTNLISFVAIVLIAVSLLLVKIAPAVASACTLIANIIAYLFVAIYSFAFVRSRRSFIYTVIWIVAVAAIVVLMILR